VLLLLLLLLLQLVKTLAVCVEEHEGLDPEISQPQKFLRVENAATIGESGRGGGEEQGGEAAWAIGNHCWLVATNLKSARIHTNSDAQKVR